MPRFRYSFVRQDGSTAHASGEADSELVLATRLRLEHCYLLKASPERSWREILRLMPFKSRTSAVALTLHELGSLIRAGLTVDKALVAVADLLPEPDLREALLRVRDAVRQGGALADAIQPETTFFKKLHVNLVRAGELSGQLDATLLQLAAHLRKQEALRSQIQLAMIYPGILVLVGISALILLATVVLPQLEPIFADSGQQMPLATRLVLGGSAFLTQFGWLLAVSGVLSAITVREILSKPASRLVWDRFKLRLPIVGAVISATQIARFSRTASTLLRAGIALPVALGMAGETVTNAAHRAGIITATAGVRSGRSLTEALRPSDVFPRLSIQLIAVGEESGQLAEVLLHLADLFETRATKQLESLVAVLVPLLTILIGTLVAGVLASILLAIMQLNQLAT